MADPEIVDNRNVIDEFKGMPVDEIRSILETRRHPFSVLLCNIQYDINTGNIVRTANAFSASRILIYGRRNFDKRGAVGTYIYENMVYVRKDTELPDAIGNDTLIAVDNTSGSVPIHKFEWPENPCLVFGHESEGISEDVKKLCKMSVAVPQSGSVRSMNVATAAGITMYDLLLRRGWL